MHHVLGPAAQKPAEPAAAQPQAPAPAPTPAPQPVREGPEFDPTPVPLRTLLEHHLSYYGFPREDVDLLDNALGAIRHDRRCKDRQGWVVFNPEGRDFLTVTTQKELSRASGNRGTAFRLALLDQLDLNPVPFGQLVLFRDEFREFFRPCSHIIALQVMSKALTAAITTKPLSRDELIDVKLAVAEVYSKRNRKLSTEKLHSVSLAVIAEAHPKGVPVSVMLASMEERVVRIADSDF